MALKSDKKFIREAVRVAQDNMFLRQLVNEMTQFIVENGVLNFSNEHKQEVAMVKNYFKSIALEKLEARGYDMGINTPWGQDASDLLPIDDFNLLSDDDLDFDVDDIYEE